MIRVRFPHRRCAGTKLVDPPLTISTVE